MPIKKGTKKEKLTPKQEKFVDNYIINGGNGAKAAKSAGYSPQTARAIASENLTKPDIQARIAARLKDAKVETDEVIGTLASHMRADLADIIPEDEILQRAKEAGVSHLIKKLKIRTRYIPRRDQEPEKEVTHEFELHDSQAAARQLCNVFGLNKADAPNPTELEEVARRAAERFMERAKAAGDEITFEYALKLITELQSEAVH